MNHKALTASLRAVAPISGVSVGVVGDRSTWRIDFAAEATQEERDAAQAALLSWSPPAPPLTFAQWLALFTQAEQDWAFGSNDASVRRFIALGAAANAIDLQSTNVAAFLDLCISLSSPLTVERKAQVLANQAPPA